MAFVISWFLTVVVLYNMYNVAKQLFLFLGLAPDEKKYSPPSNTLTSTVVNSTGKTNISNSPDATVVIIIVTLLAIIVFIVFVAIVLFLIFRKKNKKEHFSKPQISDNNIPEHCVDVRNQQSIDQRHN